MKQIEYQFCNEINLTLAAPTEAAPTEAPTTKAAPKRNKKDWFKKVANSIKQCIYQAGVDSVTVLAKITECRKTKGGRKCLKAIPQVAECFN